MNKHKTFATIISIVTFVLPFSVSAMDPCSSSATDTEYKVCVLQFQITKLQAQIASMKTQQTDGTLIGGHEAMACVNIANTLTIGSTDTKTGGDVSKLQRYLEGQGTVDNPIYPERLVTGYFGAATSRAVQKWQSANGISITTIGVAIVGPKTRSAMACH